MDAYHKKHPFPTAHNKELANTKTEFCNKISLECIFAQNKDYGFSFCVNLQ